MDEYDLLISYSSPDIDLARRLERGLVDAGVSVWWDEGDRTDPSRGTLTEINLYLMEPLLLNVKYLVVIATGAALASDWVPLEVSSFLDSKRPVIAWHPRDDEFNPLRFRPDMSLEAFDRIRGMVEHEDVIAHYDAPRSEAGTVAKNIAFLVRLFRFIEDRSERIETASVARHWDEFVASIRSETEQ